MNADDRQARLASALRANLKRRKAAAPPSSPGQVAAPAPPSNGEREPD